MSVQHGKPPPIYDRRYAGRARICVCACTVHPVSERPSGRYCGDDACERCRQPPTALCPARGCNTRGDTSRRSWTGSATVVLHARTAAGIYTVQCGRGTHHISLPFSPLSGPCSKSLHSPIGVGLRSGKVHYAGMSVDVSSRAVDADYAV